MKSLLVRLAPWAIANRDGSSRALDSGWWLGAALPLFVAFGVVGGLSLANGGFFPGAWTVGAVVLLWIVLVRLLLADSVEVEWLEVAWLALVAGFVAWTALSSAWSSDAHGSLLEARRGVLYLSALAAVLLLARGPSLRGLVVAVWASSALVICYALLRYLLESSYRFDPAEGPLLSRPLGYANAVGILAGIGILLAVALTADTTASRLRAAAAASTVPFVAALVLSSSRGGMVAVVFGVSVLLLLEPARSRLVASLAVLAPLGLAAALFAERSRLVDQSASSGSTGHAGRLLALLVIGILVTLVISTRAVDQVERGIRRLSRVDRAAAVTVVVAAAVAAGVLVGPGSGGQFWAEGYRPKYWHVAWVEYLAHPWLGSGAGTYGDYWLRLGIPGVAGGALDAHNLYLETLAEVGPFGLALLCAALALPLLIGARVRGQPLAAAAAAAYLALLAHAALDWDWELPAVMLAGLLCAAGLIVAARSERPPALSSRARAAAIALTLALAVGSLVAQIA
jgi:hypothetical protein